MNELIKTLERIAYATERASLWLQVLADQQEINNTILRDVVLKLDTLVKQNANIDEVLSNDEQLSEFKNIAANIFKK